jgi:hypothetical protein
MGFVAPAGIPRITHPKMPGISAYETKGAGCGREDFWPIVAIEGAKMRQKSGSVKEPAKQVVKEIRRVTRRQFSAEEKIRIVLTGLRGEDSIAELCRREGIGQQSLQTRLPSLWRVVGCALQGERAAQDRLGPPLKLAQCRPLRPQLDGDQRLRAFHNAAVGSGNHGLGGLDGSGDIAGRRSRHGQPAARALDRCHRLALARIILHHRGGISGQPRLEHGGCAITNIGGNALGSGGERIRAFGDVRLGRNGMRAALGERRSASRSASCASRSAACESGHRSSQARCRPASCSAWTRATTLGCIAKLDRSRAACSAAKRCLASASSASDMLVQ